MIAISNEASTVTVAQQVADPSRTLMSPNMLKSMTTRETLAPGHLFCADQQMPIFKEMAPRRFAFLLLPGYSSIYLASAIHVLSLVNKLSHRQFYHWQILSKDGHQLETSDGLEIGVHHSIDTLKMSGLNSLIICGGSYSKIQDKRLIQWLHSVADQGTDLGAISTGSYLLAAAGLLDGYQCTTHWQYVQGMREEHPQLQISSQLFVMDRNRFTCSGGSSVLDLMMHIVSRDHGKRLTASLSENLICERVREPEEPQQVPLRSVLGNSQPRLADAIALMEANIEEPIPLVELARYIGISSRQLERLFRKHMDCCPSRYYMELRLKHARRLLWQTDKSVTDIGLASGFSSMSHFSKNFREYYGHPPSDSRRQFSANLMR